MAEDGKVKVRSHPGAGSPSVSLVSLQPLVAGQPFGITVSLGPINGLVLAVDRLLDMCRTTTNVWSDSCGTTVIAVMEGEKDLKV